MHSSVKDTFHSAFSAFLLTGEDGSFYQLVISLLVFMFSHRPARSHSHRHIVHVCSKEPATFRAVFFLFPELMSKMLENYLAGLTLQ